MRTRSFPGHPARSNLPETQNPPKVLERSTPRGWTAQRRTVKIRRMSLESVGTTAISRQEAQRLARELYGFDAAVGRLSGEYDDNFKLELPDAREFVFKVMHPARDASFVEMQCQALAFLAKHAPGLRLPRVVPATSGRSLSQTSAGGPSSRMMWMLEYIPGIVMADFRPHAPQLLASLGRFLGQMDNALRDFDHPAAHRDLKWDISKAIWIREHLGSIQEVERRSLVEKVLDGYEHVVVPSMPGLRRSVIYGDANDQNVIVSEPSGNEERTVISVIDFGDMHHGITASNVAIAAAYAGLGKANPLAAAAAVVEGYHREFALQEQELEVMHALILTRLAVSVTNSAHRKTKKPDDPYVTISEKAAWTALEQLHGIHPRLAYYTFRAACGLKPVPQTAACRDWLDANAANLGPIFDVNLRTSQTVVFDLSVGSHFLGADPASAECSPLGDAIFTAMRRKHAEVGIGRYDEARLLYTASQFGDGKNPLAERRTVHLGMDLFVGPGTAVRAPLDGIVYCVADLQGHLDYGPLVILQHDPPDGPTFFSLYGHLTQETAARLRVGVQVKRGEVFGHIGDASENGGWPPHLHLQLICDLLELDAGFPGVARATERAVWTGISPDPNLLLRIPAESFPEAQAAPAATLATRRSFFNPNLRTSYQHPLKIVRGWMQYLYDETGRAFLDAYNNVPLVGHSHPRVVAAVQNQIALLNTNTRYLHDDINRYAQRLTEMLPEPLRVCFFLNSGSEANELALRLARTHTKRDDVIVLEHAYHGHTGTLIDISPYKFNGPGGAGRKPWVHVAALADDYRGRYRRDDSNAGLKYAQDIAEILRRTSREGRCVAAFIAETWPSVAGQIVFPPGYLAAGYEHVRRAGGVCIADEVQTGFGRLGTHFWGFESQGVVPDVVVLGKPIGNGFPLAAVVTTREIAAAFDNGMEFFSTFGGNPVACGAGLAVLDVLRDENLQSNAKMVGEGLLNDLKELQRKFPILGDVRGAGLFLGLELVNDQATLAPASLQTSYIVNRLREVGILTGTDGPLHNVIKLRPPLVFSAKDAAILVGSMEEVLQEDSAQPTGLRKA